MCQCVSVLNAVNTSAIMPPKPKEKENAVRTPGKVQMKHIQTKLKQAQAQPKRPPQLAPVVHAHETPAATQPQTPPHIAPAPPAPVVYYIQPRPQYHTTASCVPVCVAVFDSPAFTPQCSCCSVSVCHRTLSRGARVAVAVNGGGVRTQS